MATKQKSAEKSVTKNNKAKNSAPTQQQKKATLAPIKSTIHPNYREITVEMTDGSSFKTRSTYQHDVLKLDVDIKTHPAWTKELNYINTKDDKIAKFNNKFQGLSFLTKKN